MPLHRVIASLASLLSAAPDALLPAGRVSVARPALAVDLPALAVGVVLDASGSVTTPRFIGEGEQRVQHRALLTVQAGTGGFAADRAALDLTPLPVRRAPPGSVDADVAIVNLTLPAGSQVYRAVAAPLSADEFRLDFARARVRFGAPQRAGDELEVSHWTVSWREPLRALRLQGTLLLELWTANSAEAAALGARLQDRLALPARTRFHGFLTLRPRRAEQAEALQQPSAIGAAFTAWRQRIECAFAHELVDGGQETAGATIRRIDVAMDDAVPDRLMIGS